MTKLCGGIEAGGTKFVCAVGTGPEDIRAETHFPTTTPTETLGRAIAFFREQHARDTLEAIGIATFGPVDLNPASETYGYITATPKPGWSQTDFAGIFKYALGVKIGFDTDVNGALLGEHRWGAAQGLDAAIYLTIGTGIGGGGSSRQGCNPAGESPVVSITRVGHVAIPHLGAGNEPSDAWCKRPGCPENSEFQRWVQPGGLASVGA